MSSYDCVLPVNWTRLWEGVVPAWCQVITGQKNIKSFCDELIPKGDRALDVGRLPNHLVAPEGYLHDIGWSPTNGELRSEGLLKSNLHKEFISLSEAQYGINFLYDAIKQSAGEELPGEDAFAERPHNGFYSRLHKEPFVQVAGAKSRFHWMNGLFEETGYQRDYDANQTYCSFRPNETAESALAKLISRLLLNERTLPGVWILGPPLSWPACDDPALQGYLAPIEVKELADRLDLLETLIKGQEDELFPLFADRVKRAAAAGFGLITIHGGL